MKTGDAVYWLSGGPGPDLHVGVIRSIKGDTAVVWDVCSDFEIDEPIERIKAATDEVLDMGIRFYGGKREGRFTFRQLVEEARAVTS